MRLRNLLSKDWGAELDEYFKAALIYLDNHPNCTLEEYEEWLSHRENAIRKIKENY